MRSRPLVHRGAHTSRVLHGAATTPRRGALAKPPVIRPSAPVSPPIPLPHPLIESSCLHVQCKLPINLREFIAHQFGAALKSNDDTILAMAASADDETLSKVARAIRRYSTNRAREAWAECVAPLTHFERESAAAAPRTILCLACARIDFGEAADQFHRHPRCLTVDFGLACTGQSGADASIPDRLQCRIEEFRAMRAAFGLPHFDLDCYVASRRVTFSWRPVDSAPVRVNV